MTNGKWKMKHYEFFILDFPFVICHLSFVISSNPEPK